MEKECKCDWRWDGMNETLAAALYISEEDLELYQGQTRKGLKS